MNVKLTPKALRINSEKTQHEVADVLGLSLTQYRRKENNIVRWYADELDKLAAFYEVPIQYFFIDKVSQKDTGEGEVHEADRR
ncbi:helix-turn-helix domain-containing protein [Terrihalobacillus insolitus]|uniref:helix-turn-helix domain-containing protein n=1 Tax=Terrihalobacillus insolitus TaxID=2950438 RepID=UPI0023424A38|nr:helix-turn-helix transcriptional regulator [Terrihalobacillus insolitus]MDC3412563.1 helix-turn-helix domain-containing protein [Terrihalobacillus insolitus]